MPITRYLTILILCLSTLTTLAEQEREREGEPHGGPPFVRLPTTRVFVVEKGEIEFEQFFRVARFRDEPDWGSRFEEEIEFGVGHGLQLGLTIGSRADEHYRFRYQRTVFEVRWALAEWGELPGNPVLFGEWQINDHEANAAEVKLLLSHEFSHRVLWAANLSYAHQVGDDREREFGFSQAILYNLAGNWNVSGGVEMQVERRTGKDSRDDAEIAFLIGPSLQLRPVKHVELKLAPLFGCTDDSPTFQLSGLLEFGWEF